MDANTQELSQPESLEEDCYSFHDSQNEIYSWAILEIKNQSERIIKLHCDEIKFGRSCSESTTPDVQCETLEVKDFACNIDYQRISSHHFTIKRLLKDENSDRVFDPKFTPAVLVCVGRNGIIVDNEEVAPGQKKILKNCSKISLIKTRNILARFKYDSGSNANEITHSELVDNYFIGEIIGKGACGKVRVILSSKKVDVDHKYKIEALKTIPFDSGNSLAGDASSQSTFDGVMNEVRIMKILNNSHVMGCSKHWISERCVHFIFEYMGGGDLLQRILDSPLKYLPESDAKFFFHQILLGIQYLHNKGVTHRDIKAENIFLSNKGEFPLIKIGDMGLSKMQLIMNTKCGTYLYAAPEIIRGVAAYTHKVDIWSLGCLLYAMLSGKVPFPDDKYMTQKILKAQYSCDGFINVTKEAKEMIKFMLQPAPKNRFEANELLNYCWISRDKNQRDRLKEVYRLHNITDPNDDSLAKNLQISLNIHELQFKNRRNDDNEEDDDSSGKRNLNTDNIRQAIKRQKLN